MDPAALPYVWDDRTDGHVPSAEIWVGVRTPGTELPERSAAIRTALRAAGHPEVAAVPHDDAVLLAVHDAGMVEFLRGAYDAWTAAGYPQDPGQDRVVPYFFPTTGLLDGLAPRVPQALHALVGTYCFDTMTLVGPGTWEAARGAVDAALTAVDIVAGEGAAPADDTRPRVAYALCRPPGHHVTRAAYGGSCYLNNAGVAAEALRRKGYERVAVIDFDAHHGNGTQSLFYDRADVVVASVHVDPGAGWFPHVVGFADETGRGAGAGATRNLPLAPGTGDAGWLAAVESAVVYAADAGATALVVSLGVDAAADDPESPLQVSADGYHAAGALLAGLGVPTVAVQEGGYHLPSLGGLVVTTLAGLAG